MESIHKDESEKIYINQQMMTELSKKFPILRKEVYTYFGYIYGENTPAELDKLIAKFYKKLHDNREKLKQTKEKNPKYYKKEIAVSFKNTYTEFFEKKLPRQVFENLLKIIGTIGYIRKQQIRSSKEEVAAKKQELVDSLTLSTKEKDFFLLAMTSPAIKDKYLIEGIIAREGTDKCFEMLKIIFIEYTKIRKYKDKNKDKYYKKEAEKILKIRVDDRLLRALRQIFKLYRQDTTTYPKNQTELF